jgi:hypothetical protein
MKSHEWDAISPLGSADRGAGDEEPPVAQVQPPSTAPDAEGHVAELDLSSDELEQLASLITKVTLGFQRTGSAKTAERVVNEIGGELARGFIDLLRDAIDNLESFLGMR